MQDPPPPQDILEAVAAFLRDTAAPALPAHSAFEARVAAAALDIARRALDAGPAQTEELARLRALMGRDGDAADLTAELAERIREGALDLETPGLADHLWRTTLDKVAVDQPGYGPFRRHADDKP